MASKVIKEMNISKWGLKSGDSKSEHELQAHRKENAALKKSLEDIIKGKSSKMTPEERKRLLENSPGRILEVPAHKPIAADTFISFTWRKAEVNEMEKILALQTENEKCKNILGERNEEIKLLKERLKSRNENNDITGILGQLEEKTKEAAKREQLLSALKEEANRMNSQLSVAAAKCADLENIVDNIQNSQEGAVSCSGTPVNINEVEIQLKDALEKNRQWFVYDQQREAFVHSLLARIFELQQQLEAANQMQAKETRLEEEKQRCEQLLAAAQNDLEAQRLLGAQLNTHLNELKQKYEEAKQEVKNLNSLVMLDKQADIQVLQEESCIKDQILKRLTRENEAIKEKLDEERKRTQALSSQVGLLQRSLLIQQEENTRIAALEQQIQACTLDFEDEKLDRQSLQHQLNKVLKELHKARDQITRLEPSQKNPDHGGCVEVLLNFQSAFEDKLVIKDKCSSPKSSNLDESFLECPKCKAHYPTSQHRDLLAHIDYCAD